MKRFYAKKLNPKKVKAKMMPYNPEDMPIIYNFPPANNSDAVIAVMSFGGGLFGTLDASNKLLSGDVIDYARRINLTPPSIYVHTVDGGANVPVDGDGKTLENTMDIIQIIASCPSSRLTIHLFIGSIASTFVTMMNAILTVNPTIISISWGISEYLIPSDAVEADKLFEKAMLQGINICAASGNYGSSNGTAMNMCDFPSSSPNVIACGGTTLICPNKKYNKSTVEIAWSQGGGGISRLFKKPSFQSKLIKYKHRSTPDIAMNADPKTGVVYQVNGKQVLAGGTSIVSPSMAGYIACLNLKTSILFKLYASAKNSFNDIKAGSNGAYRATKDYDNCSGLGSINGVALKNNMFPANRPTNHVNNVHLINVVHLKMSLYDKVKIAEITDVKIVGSSISIDENVLYARRIGMTKISCMKGKQQHLFVINVVPLKMVL